MKGTERVIYIVICYWCLYMGIFTIPMFALGIIDPITLLGGALFLSMMAYYLVCAIVKLLYRVLIGKDSYD